ncbi:hypothetical protein GRF61_00870 [Azoarcus sp. TTM-91]|uniref:LPS-assembly lipoprotein LptE n=1 Tax=Azoarcus sp. TTM-91 TaxID=2691581 RepID=UPI00145CF0F7|nr:LPS assembly lipoprotein LptE [Azoarcus sp. TTM-91]NMG33000.1 hypothetical protein [Azoarcus sp. TTM-91]
MPSSLTRRRLLTGATTGLAAALLASCGFRLRGPQPLDFATIHVGASQYSDLGISLRRHIATSGSTTVVDDPATADVKLQILANEREREILSLTGAGKVREYQLIQRIRFRLADKNGSDLIPPTTILARREYTFDDSQVLGKEQEENLLYNDMQSDLVMQIMRRLAAVHRNP